MILQTWFDKWGVPEAARKDLINMAVEILPTPSKSGGETAVQNNYRAEFSVNNDGILWRNNIGAALDNRGNFIRYGLSNDSKAVNEQIKSGDLIGIKRVLITEPMVGSHIGQFVSREVKVKHKWRANDARVKAQMAWALLISSMGGDAGIVEGE